MGGNWQDATPEWKEFLRKCAEKAEAENPPLEPRHSDDEHEAWRQMNMGLDR